MKKFLFIFLILIPQVIIISCGKIDFTTGSGSNLLSLMGINLLGGNNNGIAPKAPANLQATAIAADKIDLVWENNSNNTRGFRIERSTDNNANFTEIARNHNGSDTFYNDAEGLSPGTTYYYRIQGYNAAGNSDYSNITNTATPAAIPLVPANPSVLQVAAVSSSQVNLTWHDNSDNETGFNVERRSESEADFTEIASSLPAGTTAYSCTGLNPTTSYYFRVRAYNSLGYSDYSNESVVSICPDTPGSVTASVVSSSQMNISWTDNSSNETGFRIERSTGNNSNYTEIVSNLPEGTTSYSNTGLSYNTTYYYRIRAHNAYGNSGYSNEASATTNDVVPYSPTGLTATAASSSQINIAWVDNSNNETGFRIERSGDNVTFTQIATAAAGVTSYSNTGLSPNTTYYYRVRAYNGVGNSGYSNVYSAITFNVIPANPSNLTATAPSSSRINLSWSDNSSNETSFIIQRSVNNIEFSQIATVATNVSSYSNTGLTASTTYYYRVVAHNSIGDSGYSGVAQATTTAVSTTQIIADHTIVADYDKIPAYYMAEVKKMMVYFPGESHSAAYRTGMELLEAANSAYACNVSTGEIYTGQYVRVNSGSAGEATWYTWWAYPDATKPSAKDTIKNCITEYVSHGHPIHAMGFAWCWDTHWTNAPGGTIDPVYNVHWAGSSDGGPDSNLRWGLDSGDYSLTGNRVSMDTYLGATEEYRLYCVNNGYPTKVIFTTSPADGAEGESGYQRHLKHEYIRSFARANSDRILFDYSDILCYDNNGTQTTTTWNGHIFPVITLINAGDGSIGHIGSAGALRLAKAQWWLLARIAGWDGQSQ